VPGAVKAAMPASFRPMKLVEVDQPFSRKNWSFELNLDGFRVLAVLDGGNVRILTGGENESQRNSPTITASLQSLPICQAIFEAEMVCFDEDGLPDFNCIQSRFKTTGTEGGI
jgi:bifunctional non-homologous end joining protein LigD